MTENLFGKSLTELSVITTEFGMPKYSAKQIANWLYKKNAANINDMSDLSLKSRETLMQKYEVGLCNPVKVQKSKDGTKKYLFPVSDRKFIETAMIPDKTRKTVCVSTQIGCKMGCVFCMTGKQGFNGQLTAGEIVNQLRSIEEFSEITNIVYMGMGEPFDNIDEVMKSIEILTAPWGYAMSPHRITVSSIGIIPGLNRFLKECECNLAISLHSPFEDERKTLMPIQSAYPIREVINEIRSFPFNSQRKLSFEYIVFAGLNDTPTHVKEIAKLLNGVKSHINLIRFHSIPDSTLQKTDESRLLSFKDELNNKGILTTIRSSRGEDIAAACGLLSTNSASQS